METIEMAVDFEELAAWVDAEWREQCKETRANYSLQPGEFTTQMYREAADPPISDSTANRRLSILRQAGRVNAKREVIDGNRVWVYSRPEKLDKLDKLDNPEDN